MISTFHNIDNFNFYYFYFNYFNNLHSFPPFIYAIVLKKDNILIKMYSAI